MRAEKIAKKQNNLLLEEPNVTLLVDQTVQSPATKLRDSRVCRKPGSPIQARRNRGFYADISWESTCSSEIKV